jgi:hypothetical protein
MDLDHKKADAEQKKADAEQTKVDVEHKKADVEGLLALGRLHEEGKLTASEFVHATDADVWCAGGEMLCRCLRDRRWRDRSGGGPDWWAGG